MGHHCTSDFTCVPFVAPVPTTTLYNAGGKGLLLPGKIGEALALVSRADATELHLVQSPIEPTAFSIRSQSGATPVSLSLVLTTDSSNKISIAFTAGSDMTKFPFRMYADSVTNPPLSTSLSPGPHTVYISAVYQGVTYYIAENGTPSASPGSAGAWTATMYSTSTIPTVAVVTMMNQNSEVIGGVNAGTSISNVDGKWPLFMVTNAASAYRKHAIVSTGPHGPFYLSHEGVATTFDSFPPPSAAFTFNIDGGAPLFPPVSSPFTLSTSSSSFLDNTGTIGDTAGYFTLQSRILSTSPYMNAVLIPSTGTDVVLGLNVHSQWAAVNVSDAVSQCVILPSLTGSNSDATAVYLLFITTGGKVYTMSPSGSVISAQSYTTIGDAVHASTPILISPMLPAYNSLSEVTVSLTFPGSPKAIEVDASSQFVVYRSPTSFRFHIQLR